MKKLAICIPTYNRAKILEDICLKIISIADKDIFDVYIYDSSPNLDTKEKLQDILQKKNFFYFRISENVDSNTKVYNIYQDKNIQNTYRYLWILPDYLFVEEKVFQNILEKLSEKWDMLMLDFYDFQKKGNKQYFDPNEIFLEYAWSLTQYGSMILNCKTVLKKANWIYLSNKYLNDTCRNFSHVAFYFEMLLKINNFKFYHFSVPSQYIYISIYRKSTSDYFDDYLKIWGHSWYQCIHKLPAYYNKKDIAIKKASVCTGHLGKKDIIELRVRGILTWKTFYEYRKIWNTISTVSVKNVLLIILLPKFIVKYFIKYENIKNSIKKIFLKNLFKLFCKKYNRIYIYGAGIKAEKLADFMKKESIKFDGFIVTELKDNKKILKEHKVLEISELTYTSDIGIVIALNDKNKKQVIPLLYKNKYKNLFKLDIV